MNDAITFPVSLTFAQLTAEVERARSELRSYRLSVCADVRLRTRRLEQLQFAASLPGADLAALLTPRLLRLVWNPLSGLDRLETQLAPMAGSGGAGVRHESYQGRPPIEGAANREAFPAA